MYARITFMRTQLLNVSNAIPKKHVSIATKHLPTMNVFYAMRTSIGIQHLSVGFVSAKLVTINTMTSAFCAKYQVALHASRKPPAKNVTHPRTSIRLHKITNATVFQAPTKPKIKANAKTVVAKF